MKSLLLLSLALVLPARAPAEDLDALTARGRSQFDQAAPLRGSADAVVTTPDVPAAGLKLSAPVTESSLREAAQEVMAARAKVWQGALAPEAFYAVVQSIYKQRFGADYEAKLRAFLDREAARAPPSAHAVDFARMSEEERAAFFAAMPKGAELHLHLTGGIAPDTMLEIGEKLGTKLPIENITALLKVADLAAYGVAPGAKELTVAQMSPELRAAIQAKLVTRDGENFMDFLDKWKIIGPITFDSKSYYPMMAYMAGVAKAQNIVYLELLVAGHPVPLQAAVDAAARVQAETGVTIRLIASSSWNHSKAMVDEWLAAADARFGPVVGYNVVADERISPLNHYQSFAEARAKMNRLSISLHAGEQPGTAGNIVNDLLLGPARYGHATNVQENPVAGAVLYGTKIPVEVSLISNEKTLVMTDLSKHPLKKLLAWKVPVILSTDDPGVFKSNLSQEYALAQKQFGLSWSELKEISRNGIRHSFADEATKKRLMRDLENRLADFEKSPEFVKFSAAPLK